eukprot:1868451-Amphidinium_carterae.1
MPRSPVARTLMIGGLDPATRRQSIEVHLKGPIAEAGLVGIEDTYAPQVRSQMGFCRLGCHVAEFPMPPCTYG